MTLRAALVLGFVALSGISAASRAAEENPETAPAEMGQRRERLQWIERVGALKSLMPNDLESLGVTVTVLPESREYTMRRWYQVLEVPQFVQLERSSYQVTWGVKRNNGAFLTLHFRSSDPCITEGGIERDFGTAAEHTRSGDRHFPPGQKPAPGLRPWHETYRYKLENGFDLSFGFDDACASEMSISQPMPPDWIPRAAELEGNSG